MATVIKNWVIRQALDYSKRTIILTLIITGIISSGIRFIFVDDNVMNMLPKDIESRRIWDEIIEEFKYSDFLFVAFGRDGKNVLTKENLALVWDLTEAFEMVPQGDEVLSLSTMNRMDSEDGFLKISELLPNRVLNVIQLEEIKTYLDNHLNVKNRVIGQHGDFLNVIVRPLDGAPNDILAGKLLDVADIYLKTYETYFGGAPYLTGIVSELIRNDVMMLVRAGMVVMVLILLLNLSFLN